MLGSTLSTRIRTFLRDYDRIQSFAVILIYVQIGCSLIGSLGALFNGVLIINLVISLFALVAIESSSQSLGRTYAVLLFWAVLLDIAWFILFTREILDISTGIYGAFVIFSLKVTLTMQIIGFSVRLSSTLLWIQMYRLGVSCVDNSATREADDLRESFLNPATPEIVKNSAVCDDVLGGSIYNPAYYASLFVDGENDGRLLLGSGRVLGEVRLSSSAETSQLMPCINRPSQAKDEDCIGDSIQSI